MNHSRRGRRAGAHKADQAGAGLVESIIIFPTLILMTLAMVQAGMVFHARSNINYATYEAARAATVNNASVASITVAFQKALLPYYGGGRTYDELSATIRRASGDLTNAARARRDPVADPGKFQRLPQPLVANKAEYECRRDPECRRRTPCPARATFPVATPTPRPMPAGRPCSTRIC